ncbi:MAG: hypothetical protein KAI99_14390, partial [Cyclobacteriaceae bacterium]|nr:hypothetical protein [Cyclobacteriaceae bacterium]
MKKIKFTLPFLVLCLIQFNQFLAYSQVPANKDNFHIFILMGQSNMAGYGELLPDDKLPIEGV